MRKRMIDPDYWCDSKVGKLSDKAKLLFIGLWQMADDVAYTIPYDPDFISNKLPNLKSKDIISELNELITSEMIIVFNYKEGQSKIDGKPFSAGKYLYLKNFNKWQKIDKPSVQKYPSFSQSLVDYSPTTPLPLTAEIKVVKGSIKEVNTNNTYGAGKQTPAPIILTEREKDIKTLLLKSTFFGSIKNVDGFVKALNRAYPSTPFESEFKRMESWLVSNPKKQKKDYARFINNWVSRNVK